MRYFITGASGWIGSGVTRELIGAGHEVVGLARSDESAATIAALGAEVVRGELTDLDVLREAASGADGVVHLAFVHAFDDFLRSVEIDRAAIDTIGDALAREGGEVLVIASGVAGLAQGRPSTEDDEGAAEARNANAHAALRLADRGIHPILARFAPTVHGTGGDHGFIRVLAEIARRTGVAAYVGDGSQAWGAVHRDDAARLVRLAIESPEVATRIHAVAEEGVPTKTIAEALGDRLGLPVASIDPADAMEHFGWMGRFWPLDLRASSALTRERYGWDPTGPTLLEDIAAGGYDVPAA
ncbi:SDR family oxidoreductase [Pseudolysinimonas sp.]|uniref:SDR family oxidoreductase n=1 Tax=Pseudolysinimonas sp. TaxID=2680009 RepID=UPI003F7D6DCC